MGVNTILTHSGRGDQSVEVRSVNPVVMRASTILFKDYDTWQKYRKLRATDRVLSYGARGTTTNFELEKLVCELEGGYRAQLFPTGLAALAMVLLNYAEAGAHFIVSDAIYGPVRTVCNLFLSKVKVDVSFCKADCSDVESLIQPNTKLILVESPGSILYEVIDLPKLCKIAHAHNIPVAIDNTYSSGYLYNPLKLGADISVIAATKYLSGHSDVTMGIVICSEKEWKNFDKLPEALGFTTSPDDCYLVLRGMRTLAVRMNQIEKNTDEVVAYLQTRPEIKTIFYPKLPTHPKIVTEYFGLPTIKLGIPAAVIITIFVSMIFEYIRKREFVEVMASMKVFFEGMGKYFAVVVTLIVAGQVFGKGLTAIGAVNALIAGAESMGLGVMSLIIVMGVIIGIIAFLMGSGNAPFYSFASIAPAIAEKFGVHVADVLLPLQTMTGFGRTMSPVTGGIVAVAGMAGVSPFRVVKRNMVPLLCCCVVNFLVVYLFILP